MEQILLRISNYSHVCFKLGSLGNSTQKRHGPQVALSEMWTVKCEKVSASDWDTGFFFFIGFVIYWQMNISTLHVKLLPLSNTGNKAMRLCKNCYSLHGESSLPMKRAAPTHDNLMWQYDEGRFNGNRIFKMYYVLFTHLSSTLSTGIRTVMSINTTCALKSNTYEEVQLCDHTWSCWNKGPEANFLNVCVEIVLSG